MQKRPRHLFISDSQVRPGVNTDHLEALGHYIVDKKPDVIIDIGDHADLPSLCSYENKGSKYFHDKNYREDIQAAIDGMVRLLTPMWEYNKQQKKNKHKTYNPRMVMTLGNHENRINRAVHSDPILEGTIGIEDLQYEEMGWEVHDYLEMVEIDGIYYSHYFINPDGLMGRPMGGAIANRLKLLGHSFSMGHQQVRQYGTRFTGNGKELHGLVSGAFYSHDEDYLGPQKNRQYWRGCIMKNEVKDGSYDPCFISLDYLLRRYMK